MPRHFFHVKDGEDIPDLEGAELHRHARRRHPPSGQMLAYLGEAWDGQVWQMNVTDESGRAVYRLEFSATSLPEAAE